MLLYQITSKSLDLHAWFWIYPYSIAHYSLSLEAFSTNLVADRLKSPIIPILLFDFFEGDL